MSLIKNGNFFLPPVRSGDDFKVLFARVAAAGVGRPVDKDGCPQGPWTPDLLAAAISEIEANREGIDLRTVQLWFEANDKGISANNIRWLSRVLGCNDPEAASAWQAELSASQSRLTAKRRQSRRGATREMTASGDEKHEAPASEAPKAGDAARGFGLARGTEGLFSRGSLLNLPATIFAGAVILQLVSYFLSIHDITYLREDGVAKQVGLLWAPNWTVLFILLLPLFLGIIAEQVTAWKNGNRGRLLSAIGDRNRDGEWADKVETFSHTYWVVFLVCIGFAGVFQWVSVRLLPLLNGGGNYAIDWGSTALASKDPTEILQQAAFTGFAYLYMSICFYLLIAGLILLVSLVDDFVQIRTAITDHQNDPIPDGDAIGSRILKGIARCTIGGLLIATCMKLQTLYLATSAPNILEWLVSDARALLPRSVDPVQWDNVSSPTNYTSLLVVILVCGVYLYGKVRISTSGCVGNSTVRTTLIIVFQVAVYLLLGSIPGFSLLLVASVVVAVHALVDPDFGFRRKPAQGEGYVL